MKIFTGFAMKVEGFFAVVGNKGYTMYGPVYYVSIEDFDGNKVNRVYLSAETTLQEFKLEVVKALIQVLKGQNLYLKVQLASL